MVKESLEGVRRTGRTFSKELPPAKVFIEDLKKICEVMREASLTVELRTEDRSFDTVQHLVDHIVEETLTRLHIEGKRTPLGDVEYLTASVRLSGWGVNVEAYSTDEITARGLLSQLEDIFKPCVRPSWVRYGWIAGPVLITTLPVILVMPQAVTWSWDRVDILNTAVALIVAVLFISLIFGQLAAATVLKRMGRVVMTTRAATPSFFVRNRDAIILNLGMLIIGFLLGKLA